MTDRSHAERDRAVSAETAQAILDGCACDSDIERTCRDNWPDSPGSWCGGCRILFVGAELAALRLEQERLTKERDEALDGLKTAKSCITELQKAWNFDVDKR